MIRRSYGLRLLADLLALIVLTTVITAALLSLMLAGSEAMRAKLRPLGVAACHQLAPGPAASSTRLADLTGDWQGLGPASWGAALGDAVKNEIFLTCTGVTDPGHLAFRNAADRMARAARKALAGAAPPGLRRENDLFAIESHQINNRPENERLLARWSLSEASRLLTQPDNTLLSSLAEQSGYTTARARADDLLSEITASGLLDLFGGANLINRIERELDNRVGQLTPANLQLSRTVQLEPFPPLSILHNVRDLPGTLIGLPVTVIRRDPLGTYHATRLWLTLDIEPTGPDSWRLVRWLTRPL